MFWGHHASRVDAMLTSVPWKCNEWARSDTRVTKYRTRLMQSTRQLQMSRWEPTAWRKKIKVICRMHNERNDHFWVVKNVAPSPQVAWWSPPQKWPSGQHIRDDAMQNPTTVDNELPYFKDCPSTVKNPPAPLIVHVIPPTKTPTKSLSAISKQLYTKYVYLQATPKDDRTASFVCNLWMENSATNNKHQHSVKLTDNRVLRKSTSRKPSQDPKPRT